METVEGKETRKRKLPEYVFRENYFTQENLLMLALSRVILLISQLGLGRT